MLVAVPASADAASVAWGCVVAGPCVRVCVSVSVLGGVVVVCSQTSERILAEIEHECIWPEGPTSMIIPQTGVSPSSLPLLQIVLYGIFPGLFAGCIATTAWAAYCMRPASFFRGLSIVSARALKLNTKMGSPGA